MGADHERLPKPAPWASWKGVAHIRLVEVRWSDNLRPPCHAAQAFRASSGLSKRRKCAMSDPLGSLMRTTSGEPRRFHPAELLPRGA